ncbi:MAG: hypothetical protein J6Q52_00055 [Clostridia bacterium]|nr:hypothetical protein [Clostridia bacterium]
MYFDKFKEINDELNSHLQKFDLNYARLILPMQKSGVSVVGKYAPNFFGECFITLNEKLDVVESNDFSKFYYGVSPKLDSSLIIEAISNLEFTNTKSLEGFIARHSTLFMLHKGQEKYLLPLAKYITLSVSYNYGIKIDFKDITITNDILEGIGSKNVFISQKDSLLTIHGCPTEKFLDLLGKYSYICEGDEYIAISNLDEGMSIYDIYCNKDNISLINGDVFYSGVLPRTLQIEEKESWHSNKDVTSLYLYYERSTYATVFALDNNFTNHPLIENDKEKLISFFCYDDMCKRTYLTKPIEDGKNGRQKLMSEVNRYLECSYNVNQIGVTGNIISSDGFLIYGRRAKNAIDSGKIYPSVNGNAEIADENVEFYADSVDVDYPTLSLDNATNGFGLELCREAEAELNLPLNNNLLKCYGIVISGIVPPETKQESDYPFPYRRLHFNILFKQKIDIDFKKIKQLQTIATEKYENCELHGLSVKTYKGTLDFLQKQIENFLRKLMKWKNAITSVFTIALFFLSLNTINFSLKDWSTRVSFILAVVVVLMTLVDVIKGIKERHKQKKYRHSAIVTTKKDASKQIKLTLNKILKNNSYHPVAYIALKLYLIEIVYKTKQ